MASEFHIGGGGLSLVVDGCWCLEKARSERKLMAVRGLQVDLDVRLHEGAVGGRGVADGQRRDVQRAAIGIDHQVALARHRDASAGNRVEGNQTVIGLVVPFPTIRERNEADAGKGNDKTDYGLVVPFASISLIAALDQWAR